MRAKCGIVHGPSAARRRDTAAPVPGNALRLLASLRLTSRIFSPPGVAGSDSLFSRALAETDPELAAAIAGESRREQGQIELIASENIVSRAVLEAQGSLLTNKYAEGYPG